MKWAQQKIVDIKWQFANIRRLIKVEKSMTSGLKRWWHLRRLCKKANKRLLQMAKQMENNGIKKD
jgi:hypothetical protein